MGGATRLARRPAESSGTSRSTSAPTRTATPTRPARTSTPAPVASTPATPAYLTSTGGGGGGGYHDVSAMVCRSEPAVLPDDGAMTSRLDDTVSTSATPVPDTASGPPARTGTAASPAAGDADAPAETTGDDPATGDVAAGGGAPGAPAAPEAPAETPAGGRGSAPAGRSAAVTQALNERLEDAALAVPFVPKRLPDRRGETPRLPSFLLEVDVDAIPFAAQRTLGVRPVGGTNQMPAYLQSFDGAFGGAVDRIERTYGDVLAAARAQAQQLKLVQAKATSVVQRALDEALDSVDRRLGHELKVLERGEASAIDRLALIADTARLLVRKAAQSALGTVAARKAAIRGHMSTAEGLRDGVMATLDQQISDVDMGGLEALTAFTGLAGDPSPARFPNDREPASEYAPAMENAMNEDLDPVVSHHAAERSTAFSTARDIFGQNLMNAQSAFEASAARAFQPFESYVTMLSTTAPAQIGKLRANALKSIDRMEKRAVRTIRENRNKAEVSLVERHGLSRPRLIQQGQAMAGAQNKGIQGAATAQLRGFAALAAAQAPTVSALRKRIEGQRAAPPEQFAQFVIAASRRTGEQASTMAAGRLGQAIVRARAMSAGMIDKADTASVSEAQSARQATDQLGMAAKQAAAAMMQLTLAQEAGLRRAAEPVAKSIDSFRIPAEAELVTMEAELIRLLGVASAQADAAWTGAEGPRSESPTPPPTATSEPPPPGTGSNPSAFVALADERTLAPQDDPKVTTMADRIGQTVSTNVHYRGDNLIPQMTVTGQNPVETLNLLRGMTALRGQAVQTYYNVETGGSLWNDVHLYMNVGNPASGVTTRVESILAALNYLNGNRAAGALHEVQAATEFTNNDDQAMAAMEALSPADLQALDALDPEGEILNEVEEDLGGNTGRAFNRLRTATAENAAESVAAARALRLGDRIEDDLGSHPERGADAAFDSMEGVARSVGTTRLEGVNEYGLDANFEVETREARDARQRAGWADTVARLGNDGERRADGAAGGLQWLDAAVARRRTYWETETNYWGLVVPGVPLVSVNVWQANVRQEQRDLLHSLAEFGPNDPRTRGRQLRAEETRPGGPKRERVEHARYDPRTNADMANPDDPNARMSHPRRPGDPPTDLERGLEDEAEMFRWYDEYAGRGTHNDPRPLEDIRRDLGASLRTRASDERLGRLFELQITGNPTDPEAAALAFEHAVDRAGTDEALLKDTMRRMSPDQMRAAVERYDATHRPGLYERLGLFDHEDDWFTELSGDDRLEIQVLAMGQPRNDRERAEVSRMTSRLQMNNASPLSQYVLARGEYRRMARSHDRLTRAMGVTDADFDAFGRLRAPDGRPVGNWDERGNFRPNGEMGAIAFASAMASNEAHAANYRTVTDNIANAVSMAIVIAAAVISTFFTGGAAASLWIPALITLGGGVVAMGANWAIKGGRYGYEDMGRDFGMAVVQAATAGLASGLSIGMTGGAAALRTATTAWRVSNAGFRAATLVDEALIAGAAGAFGGAGNAMFDDQAWDNGEWLSGIGRGFARGGGGGFLGGLATGVTTRAVGGLAGSVGRMRGAREAAARGLSGREASRFALARADAARHGLPASLAGRTLGGGIGGAVTRGAEIGYDKSQGRYRGNFAGAMDEVYAAGLQNAGQSMAEGLVEHRYNNHAGAEALRTRIFGEPVPVPGAPGRGPHPGDGADVTPTPARRPDEPDNADPVRRPAPANDDEPSAGRRPAADGDSDPGLVTVAARSAGEDFTTARSLLTEDPGSLGPALRPGGEEPAMMRSAIGGDDDGTGPITRREGAGDFDPDKTPPGGISIVHPTFPDGVNLKPGMLDHLPVILPDTPVRGVNPRDGVQARQNYEIMRSRQPGMEVLLAFNPTTREYVVIQGYPHQVRPMGDGWITLRHTHPQVTSSDRFAVFASILPSGIGGDFSVLRTEVDRLAAASPGATVRRSSAIDIDVNGQRVVTVFEITKSGDNYTLSVTLRPPQHDVAGIGPVTGGRDEALRQYAYRARDLTSSYSDFGLGHNPNARPDYMSARAEAPHRVVRGAALSETERHNAMFIARGGGGPDTAATPRPSAAEVHERVRAMGLVGESDSLARLTRLLNSSDADFTPEMKSAVAQAVLEATTADMRRTGALAPGDDLVMLFRGVPSDRLGDYQREGIDLKHLGTGANDDAGRGLYGSQDFQSAERYTGSDGNGAVLPLMVRRSELGNVIDVRSGTPLGDRWLAFIRSSGGGGMLKPGYDHLNGVLFPGIDNRPFARPLDGRGTRFDQFLASIKDDPSLPASVRAAAADPHITLMDLGGVASVGNDRRMLTDQWAMHSQRIADLFNVAHGFPVPGRERPAAMTAEPMMRTAAPPKPDNDNAPPTVAGPEAPAPRPAAADEAAARTRAPEADDDFHPLIDMTPEDPMREHFAALDELRAEAMAPRPAPQAYKEALDTAPHAQRRQWRDAAFAEFAAQHPADFARLQALLGHDIGLMRAIVASDKDIGRTRRVEELQARLKLRGMSDADALTVAREAIGLASDAQPRFALAMRHAVERDIWRSRIAALPPDIGALAVDSNLLHYLGANHPHLLQSLHADFLAQPGFLPAHKTTARFEEFVAGKLAGHAVLPEIVGRRILRFTNEDDFNDAASRATPHTRYEFGRLAYTTDAMGRVQTAEGVPVRVKGHRSSSSLQTEIGNRGYATDVGFHLIAHIFGAVVNELTVVSGNGKRILGDPEPNLNGSAYKVEFENIVREILDTTSQIVEVEVVSVYGGSNTTRRPDSFQVRFRTDGGRWIVKTFVNKF